ncbi:hypothetical protein [Emcibacter sp.]|uniref:hypothetical protein n=1 Tax=Emcibacter sp. TaxID=1979954 RepID=UPI003A917CFB
MNDKDLKDYLELYGRFSQPEPSAELTDRLLRIPGEVEQAPVPLLKVIRERQFWNFFVPRLAGLAFACAAGIYFGMPADTSGDDAGYEMVVDDYITLGDEIFGQEDVG